MRTFCGDRLKADGLAQVLRDQVVHLFRGIILTAVNTDLDAVTRIIRAGIIDNLDLRGMPHMFVSMSTVD